ncbi:alcohol dehydrogenase-like 4 [Impatiens glandulifera]|uniref:alcohol dehydrogenase-like 4 n=1 Tax=Impatiens glandulifera TaxID=253017 RepID=UPI001FB15660|nr:alcohol dehydrogenase-like 4 [Impatiens glandulifera]
MGSVGNDDNIMMEEVVAGNSGGKVISCRAAVAWGPGQPLSVEEILVQPPHRMEVRIRILFTSICHTDLTVWKGLNEAQRVYPRIFGHESAGIVESLGEGVMDFEVGDHVVPIFNGECGDCVYCIRRDTNLCEKFRVNPLKSVMTTDGKCRFSTKDGKPIFHFLNTSTFSEYTVLDSACLVKIHPNAPLKKMTLLSCGVSTGLGAAWNTANVTEGATVAIFGLGAVGLAVAEGARVRGASKIIGVDVNPTKAVKGKRIGITDFINPNDLGHISVDEKIKEMTGGGVDFSFECAGNLDVLRQAFLSTHDGWGLTIVLGIHPSPRLLPLHPMELFDGRRIVASIFGDFKGKTQLPILAQQCMNGEVKLDEFITHELPFNKINEAFQLLIDGECLRCLLYL